MERRLTTILAADVVGYSRLMGVDEAATLSALKAHRKELLDPKAQQYRGRTIKLMGDGVLMEFASVVDAICFAVEFQCAMRERNAEVPDDRRIRFRIGINVGDIIVEGDDIYGDGVNIASRLENLAEPGGICIRRNVRNQIRDKLDLTFEDQGEIEVKNITRPIRAFKVVLDHKAEGLVTPVVAPPQQRTRRPAVMAAAAATLVVLLGGLAWWQPRMFSIAPASVEQTAFPLPDKPSIAVLPFTSLSDEESQDYFAEGMADDIITDLSKISDLFVIARRSSFEFDGSNLDPDRVAEELGVRFLLKGTVQRGDDRIRINAQLLDARSGAYVWAERFNSDAADVFELQDRVTRRIANSLAVELTTAEQERHDRGETEDPDAHDAFLRGWAHYQRNTPEDYAKAVPYFEEAIELDPQYERAFAALAAVYWDAFANGRLSRGGEWVRRLDESLTGAYALAAENLERALELSPDPLAYQVSSGMLVFQGRHEEAIAEAERAIELNENDPAGYEALGKALIFAGRPARSIDVLRTAMRLDPAHAYNYQHWLGVAQFGMENFSQAADLLAEASQRNPDDERILIPLAATYGMLDRQEDGERAVERLNDLRELENERLASSELTPGVDLFLLGPLTLQDMQLWPFKEQADRDRLEEGLRRIGVPPGGEEEKESPRHVPGAVTIDVAQAKELFDQDVTFIDARGPSWNLGHIPGAKHLFLKDDFTEESLAAVADKTDDVVFYCMGPSCLLSSKASARAVSWGYENVYYFRDGFPAWQAAGHPVAIPD